MHSQTIDPAIGARIRERLERTGGTRHDRWLVQDLEARSRALAADLDNPEELRAAPRRRRSVPTVSAVRASGIASDGESKSGAPPEPGVPRDRPRPGKPTPDPVFPAGLYESVGGRWVLLRLFDERFMDVLFVEGEA